MIHLDERSIPMLNWVVRIVLMVAGVVASWFVAKDALSFGLVQMTIAILLCTLVVLVLAFWPACWTSGPMRTHKRPPTA